MSVTKYLFISNGISSLKKPEGALTRPGVIVYNVFIKPPHLGSFETGGGFEPPALEWKKLQTLAKTSMVIQPGRIHTGHIFPFQAARMSLPLYFPLSVYGTSLPDLFHLVRVWRSTPRRLAASLPV
jgi:hypothetical protein